MPATCSPSWGSAVAEALRRLALAALLAGALPSTSAWCATHTIVIDGMRFQPATLAVRRGDRVVWVNRDLVPHTATARQVFDSGPIAPGASRAVTMTQAGRHDYVCTLHPTMKASLVVK